MIFVIQERDRSENLTEIIEAWGGAECTVNRVNDAFGDQLCATKHGSRAGDFGLMATLGLSAVRFPILWERVSPAPDRPPDWTWTDRGVSTLRASGIGIIAGLIHHGSGPRHTSLLDPAFAAGLADHAARTVERYPWIDDWTPVNEPLTTARFSALYGFWYPHLTDERSFWEALLNQIDATRLAMRAIRRVNPAARLIQTEDLGRTYATAAVRDQAAFDNQRRWMSWDLLCGMVDAHHPLWPRLCGYGLQARLEAIHADPCPPDVIGINHYLTSDRLLDHRTGKYPPETVGGSDRTWFADVEAVRALDPGPQGLRGAIDEAWSRYGRPLALTEVHNGCTREEQVRWLAEAWAAARAGRARGVDVRAVTAWALFGSQGWDTLLTQKGRYEPGAFDVSSGHPRETALANVIRARGALPANCAGNGWWRRDIRLVFPRAAAPAPMAVHRKAGEAAIRPILIAGATGTLGRAFASECHHRDLPAVITARDELDLLDAGSIASAIERHQPWAVINAAGWVRVDDAEAESEACHGANATGAIALAEACAKEGIASVSFSSDLVFDGTASAPYAEDAATAPRNVYGASKAALEGALAKVGGALIVRTAAFFSPHDRHNFAVHCIDTLRRGERFKAVDDCVVSPTYVPDLCRETIDLLIDGEDGIWHLTNDEGVSWYQFARRLAAATGSAEDLITAIPAAQAGWIAERPGFCPLTSHRGRTMPSLQSAIDRFAGVYRSTGPIAG